MCVSHALPPTAVVFTPRSPGAHVYYPLSRDKALLTSILIGCGRSRRPSCRARGRLHARRGGSAARAVAICCGRTVPMANDVRTCDLGVRGLLPVGAARRLCRTVRTPPADRRGRAPRTLDAPALDTHVPLSANAAGCHGRSQALTCPSRTALAGAESAARQSCVRSAARAACTSCLRT